MSEGTVDLQIQYIGPDSSNRYAFPIAEFQLVLNQMQDTFQFSFYISRDLFPLSLKILIPLSKKSL